MHDGGSPVRLLAPPYMCIAPPAAGTVQMIPTINIVPLLPLFSLAISSSLQTQIKMKSVVSNLLE